MGAASASLSAGAAVVAAGAAWPHAQRSEPLPEPTAGKELFSYFEPPIFTELSSVNYVVTFSHRGCGGWRRSWPGSFGWHIIRNRVAGAKGKATMTDRFGNHVFDILVHILGIQAAYCIGVDAAEVSDPITIFLHQYGKGAIWSSLECLASIPAAMMSSITGTGCQLSALTAAFVTANQEHRLRRQQRQFVRWDLPVRLDGATCRKVTVILPTETELLMLFIT